MGNYFSDWHFHSQGRKRGRSGQERITVTVVVYHTQQYNMAAPEGAAPELTEGGMKAMLEMLRSQARASELAAGAPGAASAGGLPGKGGAPDITPEELSQLSSAFEKPEFRKLFQEYVDEVTDPKVRAETEAHLRQLEEAGEMPRDLKLVRPKPAFALESKLKDEFGGHKVYVNVVVSGGRVVCLRRGPAVAPRVRRARALARARARTKAGARARARCAPTRDPLATARRPHARTSAAP